LFIVQAFLKDGSGQQAGTMQPDKCVSMASIEDATLTGKHTFNEVIATGYNAIKSK